MTNNSTPLSRAANAPESARRASPVDALELACKKWLGGERIEIGALALDLGVSKATLFRWIGNRDKLIGEVIWSQAKLALHYVDSQITATGVDYVAQYSYGIMRIIAEFEPLQNFLRSDTERAINIITGSDSIVHERFVAEVKARLETQQAAGHIRLKLEAKDLAFLIVRLAEAVLYRNDPQDSTPQLELMRDAVRFLLIGQAVE